MTLSLPFCRARQNSAMTMHSFGCIWSIAANTYKKYLRRKSRVSLDELAEDIPSEDDFTQQILRSEETCVADIGAILTDARLKLPESAKQCKTFFANYIDRVCGNTYNRIKRSDMIYGCCKY